MYFCFVCKKKFETIKILLSHFSTDHRLKNFGVYKCSQRNCFQHFSSKWSFSKHLIRHQENERDKNLSFIITKPNPSMEVNLIDNTLNSIPDCDHNQPDTQFCSKDTIMNSALEFSSELYAKSNFSRKDTIEIQTKVTNMCEVLVSTIKDSISNYIDLTLTDKLNEVLELSSKPFQHINTEFKFIQSIQNNNLFKRFHSHTVNNDIIEQIRFGQPTLGESNSKAYIMPLRFQFQKFFEMGNIFQETLDNTEALESQTVYFNFVNGSLYKSKKEKIGSGKIVLPFFLYSDDFEINNPLGSHATEHSMCAFYYSFPTLPQHLLSNLHFIFVAALIKSRFIKNYGSNSALYGLIQEIRFLEEMGIDINSQGTVYHVHFTLGLVLGDNLGMKTMFGFCKAFNCDKFCRLCRRNKIDLKKDTKELDSFIRNVWNYTQDIEINDYRITGIIENSLFNDIETFHVTENFSVDLMHDIFEGICCYDICQALLYFIDKKYFSLEFLNTRKQNFMYGETEIGNFSCPLQLPRLVKSNLRMSASETRTFTHFLPLIIGDKIPRNDKVWKLIILLIKIIHICLYSSFTENDITLLVETIASHHQLYVKLFGPLKPKHHFLVHYGTAIRTCGPLKKIWCLRFEAKHKELKKYMSVNFSRKNSSFSLAMKVSFQFSNFILQNKATLPLETYTVDNKENDCGNLHSFLESLKLNKESFISANTVTYKGTSYKKNFYLTSFSNTLHLHKIVALLIDKQNKFMIVSSEIHLKGFDNHYQAYIVGQNTNELALNFIDFFASPPLHIYNMSDGSAYLRNKTL